LINFFSIKLLLINRDKKEKEHVTVEIFVMVRGFISFDIYYVVFTGDDPTALNHLEFEESNLKFKG